MERLQKPQDVDCPIRGKAVSSSMQFHRTELRQSQVVVRGSLHFSVRSGFLNAVLRQLSDNELPNLLSEERPLGRASCQVRLPRFEFWFFCLLVVQPWVR